MSVFFLYNKSLCAFKSTSKNTDMALEQCTFVAVQYRSLIFWIVFRSMKVLSEILFFTVSMHDHLPDSFSVSYNQGCYPSLRWPGAPDISTSDCTDVSSEIPYHNSMSQHSLYHLIFKEFDEKCEFKLKSDFSLQTLQWQAGEFNEHLHMFSIQSIAV